MKNVSAIASALLVVGVVAGCTTMTPEEERAAYQKEFSRIAALPPAEKVASPNAEIDKCAKLSADLFNEVQPLMKAYVSQVETCREYTAFMNEIQYCVEKEKLSNQEACKKVTDAVKAADEKRADDQKVWPKIQTGIDATNALDPKKQLAQIAVLSTRNVQIVDGVKNLPQAYASEDVFGKAKRGSECVAIGRQLDDVRKCLTYLADQYNRVLELDDYTR